MMPETIFNFNISESQLARFGSQIIRLTAPARMATQRSDGGTAKWPCLQGLYR
jgi:hypothetical protein